MAWLNFKLCCAIGFFLVGPSIAQAGTVTAKTTLQRGTIIQAEDLRIAAQSGESKQDILNAYVGKELKRTVAVGYRLNPAYVGKPVTVKRNSRVSMIFKSGALEITAWGRALQEGGTGDIISVMNLDSRKTVQGEILANGIIRVGR